LAQGVLVDLIIEKIKINPQTPVADILKFREDHADELGRFRSEIESLTKTASADLPIEHLHQSIQDTYTNKVLPALNDLKSGLVSSRIHWVSENALKITSLSVAPGSLFGTASLAFGLAAPQALLVGVGVSLTASIILYNLQRRQAIRENPYAFVLSAEKQFGRAG
jgi:hypothetical protein